MFQWKRNYPNTSQRIIKTVVHFTTILKKKKEQQSKKALILIRKNLRLLSYYPRY